MTGEKNIPLSLSTFKKWGDQSKDMASLRKWSGAFITHPLPSKAKLSTTSLSSMSQNYVNMLHYHPQDWRRGSGRQLASPLRPWPRYHTHRPCSHPFSQNWVTCPCPAITERLGNAVTSWADTWREKTRGRLKGRHLENSYRLASDIAMCAEDTQGRKKELHMTVFRASERTCLREIRQRIREGNTQSRPLAPACSHVVTNTIHKRN